MSGTAAIFSRFLVLGCLFVMLFTTPARALDARNLFQRSQRSVVMIIAVNKAGKISKIGSGVLLRRGDLVATNHHVIAGEKDVRVKMADGKVVKIESVRAESPEHDLALLMIPPLGRGLPLASGDPVVGEEILAIGNPRGLERTLSTGVVSGIRQKGNTKVYQITAPISRGSSGGPILNDKGEVIGLASFFAQGGQNLNFAIPASYIAQLLGLPPGKSPIRHLDQSGSKLTIERDESGITIMQSK